MYQIDLALEVLVDEHLFEHDVLTLSDFPHEHVHVGVGFELRANLRRFFEQGKLVGT